MTPWYEPGIPYDNDEPPEEDPIRNTFDLVLDDTDLFGGEEIETFYDWPTHRIEVTLATPWGVKHIRLWRTR